MRPTAVLRTVPGPQNGPPQRNGGSNGQMPPRRENVAATTQGRQRSPGGRLSSEASTSCGISCWSKWRVGLEDELDAGRSSLAKGKHLDARGWRQGQQAFQARLARLQKIPDEDLSPAEREPPAAKQESGPALTRACWHCRGEAAARQTAPAIRSQTALPRLRTGDRRPPPFAFCAAPRT